MSSARSKILVVDDDRDVRESTMMLVRSLGCETVGCGEADRILDTVEHARPDLLLQDLNMPGLNVAGLIATLRSHDASASMPIVLFSARTDLAAAAARHDVAGYLHKPFSGEELARLLRAVLGSLESTTAEAHDLEREVSVIFHNHWNVTTALNNYAAILRKTTDLPPEAQNAVAGIESALLRLESQTDQLRSYMQEALKAQKPRPAPRARKPAKRAHALNARKAPARAKPVDAAA